MAWDTYFLLAEAAARGWKVPISGQAAYEQAITLSFQYWDNNMVSGSTAPGSEPISPFLSTYLASTDYNRNGTSVAWTHTTEPPATVVMKYVNGYTGDSGTINYTYPVNGLYQGGAVHNDLLTKIITQKFIADMPYLPLETWSDFRRLGLPFFPNPAVELPIPTMPALTSATYMNSSVKFFPQRQPYPSTMKSANATGYQQAVSVLGSGGDEVLTPLWWALQQP